MPCAIKHLPLALLLALTPLMANAQNAPLTILEDVKQAEPGLLEMPIIVEGFDNIGAVYLSLDYDYSVVQLTGATPHPQMPTFIHGDNDLGTGFHRITMGWYGEGLSLPDSSVIMTLLFNFTEGYTELAFYDNGPSCEYANGDGQVLNDIPTSQYYYNGWTCGGLSHPGPIIGESMVCQGRHAVSYSVAPMPNASDYVWEIPVSEVDILCGQGTNLVVVDWAADAQSCNVEVHCTNPCGLDSPVSTLPVTVHPVPIANAGMGVSIPYGTFANLQGSVNGPGDFSYHWSPEELLIDPDVMEPQTVPLTSSTIFTLLVTNLLTGCQDIANVFVSLSNGPLSIHPTAIKDSICYNGSSLLYSLASGGTGSYSYSWVSDPPGLASTEENTSITPDTTTLCILTVDDGYNSVTDTVTVTVLEETAAIISGSDTLCGDEGSTLLTIDLTGTPPWDFVYTFGLQSVYITSQMTTPYELETDEPGIYTIPFVKDLYCDGTGSGSSLVAQYPIPPAPMITQIENTLISNLSWGNQWYKNDEPIPGATGISYTVTETGNYYANVMRFGCSSDTSNNIYIVIPGIPENDNGTWMIFPNPARDRLNIHINGNLHTPISFTLFTPQGMPVLTHVMASPFMDQIVTLDVRSLPAGIYFLQYASGDSLGIHKIIIIP